VADGHPSELLSYSDLKARAGVLAARSFAIMA
jgi:hypothetical protein